MGLARYNVDSDGSGGEPLTTLILRVPVLYVYGTWIFSADGLAPNGSSPSAGTELAEELTAELKVILNLLMLEMDD